MNTLEVLKKSFTKEHDTKDLGKVKIIIGWQINQDTASGTMKISQSAFIQDLIIEEELTECNANVILMKASSVMEMTEPKDYEEANLRTYQRFISKLIYRAYGTRPNISFAIRQLSRYNANSRKGHF